MDFSRESKAKKQIQIKPAFENKLAQAPTQIYALQSI